MLVSKLGLSKIWNWLNEFFVRRYNIRTTEGSKQCGEQNIRIYRHYRKRYLITKRMIREGVKLEGGNK